MKYLATAVALVAALAAGRAQALDVQQPAVKQFISRMTHKHGFRRAPLTRMLAATQYDQQVIALMKHPAEAMPWYRYRAILVTPKRIAAGRRFMAEHRHELAAAERKYGVPPQIVTALIGMESFYGRREGGFSALSALVTLAFDYPPRANYFRHELENYLILCRRNHLDPQALKSSYAGALGAGQFMPSSYLAYAVDADGGGSNLFVHWPDIIASIAHFLAVHGWRAGMPVAAPAALKPGFDSDNLFGRVVPIKTLRAKNIVFDVSVADDTPARLVKVAVGKESKDDNYWIGLPNFSVLMAYNDSVLYALAATQIAGALAAAPASAGVPVAAGRP